MKKINGLVTAPFTGMNPDHSINLPIIKDQAALYQRNGVKGAFICGTTGESSSLTLEEKKILFKAWAPYQNRDFAIIAFVGGTCIEECRELAAYAEALGLFGIAFTAPYYFKPTNVDALCACCKAVAEAAPNTDFFYYNIPFFTGVNVPMIDLLKKMDEQIPNLSGIKFTYENMMDFQLCLNFKNKKYNIMWGRDEMFLEALAIGATSAVGSTYNYSSKIYLEIREAFERNEHVKAADLQYKAIQFITLLNKYGGGTGKAMMKAIGLDLGTNRLPIIPITDAQYNALIKDLNEMDFFDYASK